MKRTVLILTALATLAGAARASIVFSENFNAYTNGPIVGNAGVSPWVPNTGTVNTMLVTNQQLEVSTARTEDIAAPLSGAPYMTNGTVTALYSKFTVNFIGLPTAAGTYFAHLTGTDRYGTLSGHRARVWANTTNAVTGAAAAAGTLYLGIGNASAVVTNGQLPTAISTNVTYTVVTRYVIGTATATLWVNPAAESDPGVTAVDYVDPTNYVNVTYVAFRQATGEGTLRVDDLKVGTSFSDVAGTNTSPTISAIPNQAIPANGSAGPLTFTVNDAESSADSLVVTASSSNTSLVPNGAPNLVLGGSGATRSLTVTPAASQQGTTTITVSVSDGVNTSFTSFTVVVGAPAISAIANQIAVAGATIPAIPFTVVDAEGDPLSPSASSSNPTLLKNSNITVNGTGSSRTVTLVPEAGQTGVTTVTLSFSDGFNTSNRSFVLTVSPNPGILLQDQFTYTAWNFMPQSLYDAVGSVWSTASGTAYQVQVTNGWCYLGATNSEDVAATLTNGPFASTSGLVVYSSFTLRCTQLPTSAGNYFAHLKDALSGTTFRAKVFTATNGAAAGHYRIGVANSANVAAYFPLDCAPDTDYLVVTRYNSGTGESVLWVNPYTEGSPSLAATDNPLTAQVGAFGFREDTSSGTSGNLQISNLVVSTSFPSLPQPPAQPDITSINVSAGTVTIGFTAGAGDSAADFQLYSAAAVTGTYTGPASGSSITALGSGKFQATVPTSGSQQFYRIKR